MSRRETLTLIAAILGSGIVGLDSTVVNIALPTIASSMHATYSGLQWIIDGYLLSLSALILIGGSLGDIFGQKRVFEWGVIGFGLTSVLCGIAPSITMLVICRLFQGVFGALLVPSSLAVINTTFPRTTRGKAIGLWTAYGGIFVALGPLIGGLLIGISWRWIFLVNFPLSVACMYIIRRAIRDPRQLIKRAKVDLIGCFLAFAGLGATTFGLIEGPDLHWNAVTLISIVAGCLFLLCFALQERTTEAPMLPLELFQSRNFTGANLMTIGMYAALAGAIFSVILYLQTGLHYSPIEAGLTFLPVTILMFLLSGRVGSLSSIYGPRLFLTTGPVIVGLGFLAMLRISPAHSNYLLYVLPSVVIFGVGLCLTVAPLTTTVMTSVSQNRSGIASAVNNAVARLAGLLVVAFLGIFVAYQTTHSINSSPLHLSTDAKSLTTQAVAEGLKSTSLLHLSTEEQAHIPMIVSTAQRGIYVDSILLNSILAFSAGIIALFTIQSKRN